MSKVRLSEIAMVTAGNVAPKAKDFTPGGVPFVRAGSLSSLLETGDFSQLETVDSSTASKLRLKLFPAGTVVFAKSGMSCLKGHVYTLPRECYVVSHLACITPKEGYSKYLQHYFRYWKPNRLIENPSFPSIKLSNISNIELDLPEDNHAQEIVNNLEAVLDAVNEGQLQINKLDELVKARFVEMFGDPDTNPKSIETKSGSALFTIGNGKTRPKNHRFEQGVPAYGGNGISWYTNEVLVHHPTIVIGRVGRHCGNTRLVEEPCWVTDNAMFIREFKDDCFDMTYLSTLMAIIEFNRFADAGDLWKITQKPFMEYRYPVPPLALQREFATVVRQVDQLKADTQLAIDKLQMLYDSLAQEYFDVE